MGGMMEDFGKGRGVDGRDDFGKARGVDGIVESRDDGSTEGRPAIGVFKLSDVDVGNGIGRPAFGVLI